MQNFENKLNNLEKNLKNIRGIFDRNKVENKIKELEIASQKKTFGKIKSLLRRL